MAVSRSERVWVVCPGCSHRSQQRAWKILDLVERPETRGDVRDGKFNVFTCPSCSTVHPVPAGVLFLQTDRQPVLFFSQARDDAPGAGAAENAVPFIQELRQILGRKWKDEWVKGGLAIVPRNRLAAALSAPATPDTSLPGLGGPAGMIPGGGQPGVEDQIATARKQQVEGLMRCLGRFTDADSWEEAYEVIAENQDLLSEAADAALDLYIEKHRARGDTSACEMLQEHRDLLKRCREDGVDVVFGPLLGEVPSADAPPESPHPKEGPRRSEASESGPIAGPNVPP